MIDLLTFYNGPSIDSYIIDRISGYYTDYYLYTSQVLIVRNFSEKERVQLLSFLPVMDLQLTTVLQSIM